MIRLALLLIPASTTWVGYVIGRWRNLTQPDRNHASLVHHVTRLLAEDRLVPSLSTPDRERLARLVDDYYHLPPSH